MKSSIAAWIKKADGDYTTALREYRARKSPNYDSACFHAQQCIEKYLKAVLESQSLPVARIHDLAVLLDACLGRDPLWSAMRNDMELLSQYAVSFRYPGYSASRRNARLAIAAMKRCRAEIKDALQ